MCTKIKQVALLIALLLCMANTVLAQDKDPANSEAISTQDVLYLKDGSVLRGSLAYYIQGREIVFILSTGDTLRYPERKIRRFVQGGAVLSGRPVKPARRYEFREEGLYFTFGLGLGVGRTSGSDNTVAPQASASAGYQLNRWLGVGAGFGVDAYQPDRGEVIYPLFGEARGYLTDKRQAPYYALRLGYGLAFAEEENRILEAQGGWFFQPLLGIRWGASAGVNFLTSVGLQFQGAEFTRQNGGPGEVRIDKKTYKRMHFGLGIVF